MQSFRAVHKLIMIPASAIPFRIRIPLAPYLPFKLTLIMIRATFFLVTGIYSHSPPHVGAEKCTINVYVYVYVHFCTRVSVRGFEFAKS